jgi:hypothetical protein
MITDVKTTMVFSPAFHMQLKRVAEQMGKPMAQVIEETLTPILDEQEKARRVRIHEGLMKLSGSIKDDLPHASQTIDEVVYGENVTTMHE